MTLEDLGHRAVACKHWRFMDGMLTTCGLRVVDGGRDYVIGHRSGATRDGGGWYDGDAAGFLPDLSDPATLGCLLALVREETDGSMAEYLSPIMLDPDWSVGVGFCPKGAVPQILLCMGKGSNAPIKAYTEAEALVAALEAAP